MNNLKQLFTDHADNFAKSKTDFGFCNLLQHDIDTQDARPIKQSPHRPSLAARDSRDTEDEIVDDMLEEGVINRLKPAW